MWRLSCSCSNPVFCSLLLTCPPGVTEVTLHHAAGLAVPTADPTPVFLGRRPDDAITADFLKNQSAGLFLCLRFTGLFKEGTLQG